MSASWILPDEPVPDFRVRISRRGAARSIGAPRGRRLVAKRLGVLAVAVAVPALAAPTSFPHGFQTPDQMAVAAPQVMPMAFETPGESFPGSAFYYLEDVPPLVADTDAVADTAEPPPDWPVLADAAIRRDNALGIGPAARSLTIAGSASDQARAQECLTMAIYYEAASESDSGQRAVAQVVLNRVANPGYPNTVCGVVFQGSERTTGCQFSFTCDGSLARRATPEFWSRAGRIARQALAGAVHAPVGLATHYHTLAVHPRWASSLDQVTVIGAHQFYRRRGIAGTRAAFTALYTGGEPPARRHAGDAVTARTQLPLAAALPASFVADNSAALAQASALQAAYRAPAAEPSLPTGGGVKPEYAQSGTWRQTAAAQARTAPFSK